MRRQVSFVFVSVLVVAGAAWAGSNLIQNGSFEDGTFAANGPGYETLYSGDKSITGWTVIGGASVNAPATGSLDWINGYWQAQDGTHSLDLDGLTAPGGVSQTFATTAGAGTVYTVSFFISGNPDGPPVVKFAIGSAKPNENDLSQQLFSFEYDRGSENNSLGDMKWQEKHFSFVADSTSTTLTIQSGTDPRNPELGSTPWVASFGAAIDNVSVVEGFGTGGSPVPEPVTMFSAFMAISGLGMYIRKRMKAPVAA